MKIGIDARICDEGGYYGQYCWELAVAFCRANTEHDIVIFRNNDISGKIEKTISKTISQNRLKLSHDRSVKKIFAEEKFAIMIFFDHHIPHGYKGDYIVIIESLQEVFFPKKRFFARKLYAHRLAKAIKHSQKVLVMDGGTALELNERLNIQEHKIGKIHGFFPRVARKAVSEMEVNVTAKHNLRGKYLIYDSGNEMHNNFERILKTFAKLQEKEVFLYLIILCEDTNKDLDVRNKAIDYGIAEQIIFLGPVEAGVEGSYYSQSAGVVFSSIYESFPFHFSKAMSYNTPILANDIPAISDVMGHSICYLDPLSINNITDTIAHKLSFPEVPDYSQVRANFNSQKSAFELHRIIEAKD